MPVIGATRGMLLALVLAGALPVAADAGTPTEAGTPAETGASSQEGLLAVSCSGCHAVDERLRGTSSDGVRNAADRRIPIPSLTGLSVADLETRLMAYRDGSLPGTVMNRIARGYTVEEIRTLARVLGASE